MKNGLPESEFHFSVDFMYAALVNVRKATKADAKKIDITGGEVRRVFSNAGALRFMEICGFHPLKTRSDGSWLVLDAGDNTALGVHIINSTRTWEATTPDLHASDGSCVLC